MIDRVHEHTKLIEQRRPSCDELVMVVDQALVLPDRMQAASTLILVTLMMAG